jgi:hypothetical protein
MTTVRVIDAEIFIRVLENNKGRLFRPIDQVIHAATNATVELTHRVGIEVDKPAISHGEQVDEMGALQERLPLSRDRAGEIVMKHCKRDPAGRMAYSTRDVIDAVIAGYMLGAKEAIEDGPTEGELLARAYRQSRDGVDALIANLRGIANGVWLNVEATCRAAAERLSGAPSAPRALAALRELVACKDLHDSIGPEMSHALTIEVEAEYKRRKPLAWAEARATLAAFDADSQPERALVPCGYTDGGRRCVLPSEHDGAHFIEVKV